MTTPIPLTAKTPTQTPRAAVAEQLRPPRVLVVHNFYQQAGGEDAVFRAETALLSSLGAAVQTHTVHNDELQGRSALISGAQTIWNPASARTLADLVRAHRSEVVHFHNTFPIISPAAYSAVRAAGAAVVQTLHNYRLMCAAATFYRDGQPCEACLGKTPPLPAVQHACYRDSRAGSAALAGMLTAHRWLGTYTREVDRYIALTEFARDKYIQGGLPPAKLVVKPNFLAEDPGMGAHQGGYALFVGRLAPEKGIMTLLNAWAQVTDLPLKIAGDGPLADQVVARQSANVKYLGRQDNAQIRELMRDATMLIFPSEWYEGFPMTLIEAFASGLPVIASKIGSMPEIVAHQRTGLHFRPGDAADLARQVQWLSLHPSECTQMGLAARQDYQTQYTAQHNSQLLLDIYRQAQHQYARQQRTSHKENT
ncbi:glycosyltransferase family 4 protein [Deinococcus sp.]|uniref:glycosyltransferase family 4 protein n=1 Tax=Deinococcus sp. TaxID=47478 RepID=UPI003B5C4A67